MDYFENANIPISQKGNYLLISERKKEWQYEEKME